MQFASTQTQKLFYACLRMRAFQSLLGQALVTESRAMEHADVCPACRQDKPGVEKDQLRFQVGIWMRTPNARRAKVRMIRKLVVGVVVAATMMITPVAQAQEAAASHRVAVVDVAYIFKNHKGIKAQVSAVEADLKAYDAELKKKRDELKLAAEKLKAFKPGTPDYIAQEEKVASMDSKLRLDMARKRKELADAEAKIYYDNYQKIAAGVKFLAGHYKINLVLRYNSEDMEPDVGESVIRGVMKNIVYHDESLDMTPGVMQYLDRVIPTPTSTPAGSTARNPNGTINK